MCKPPFLVAFCFLAAASTLLAQAPTPAKPAAPVPAASPPALPADDLEALRIHVSETVDVRGTPTATGHSKSGTVAYLNFGPAHAAVSAVAFLKNEGSAGDPAARRVQSEDDLKPFVGKTVIVHGKLADYKGNLQIVLDSLDQIKPAS